MAKTKKVTRSEASRAGKILNEYQDQQEAKRPVKKKLAKK